MPLTQCYGFAVFLIFKNYNMTSYEEKGYIIETLKNEIEKPKNEQSKWKTHLFFCPEIGLFILNDSPVSSKNVFELLKSEFIVYDGIKLHQGEYMPSYKFNTNR